jgi:pilus assembly protein CpaC
VKNPIFILIFILFFLQCYGESRELTIKEGTSRVIKVEKAKAIEVVNKNVASATILSDEDIILEAKKSGTSVINITTESGIDSLIVNVKKQKFSESMIEVDVQILEITTVNNADFGIDWPSMLNGPLPKDGIPTSPINALEKNPPGFKVLGADFSRGSINLVVDFLVKNNYAKILARPKLLAASGKKASFLSGGEVPIVTVSSTGQANIDWKKYGVSLDIEPTITKQGSIEASIKAEVSNLDYANAVSVGTSVFPALKTRRAETNINVEPDNTVVIAGLIENQETKVTSGVPVLSAIPLIGELFKTSSNMDKKTELVIFVTPNIAGQEAAQ